MTAFPVTRAVLERLEGTPDPRLREVMSSLVRHLHAFAIDVGLTQEEWLAGIGFLTETGKTCDATRQEFVLLSDTLGLSTLVDDLANAARDEATEATILGPFHVPGAPFRDPGASIVLDDAEGEALLVSGTVTGVGGEPVAGAVVDVWQAGPDGHYDVQDAEQPEHNFRGRFRTDTQGRYGFATLRPVSYPIPDDGPAGRLLRATGRHPWRPAHIHVMVTAEGYRTLTTAVFDARDTHIGSDAVFGVKESLARTFALGPDGLLHLEEHFRLRPAP
ncbi:dioxygenase [Streptosporangium saharense]|uniref:dioxygenase family protein n=1 Tax=Streptosporangium saharense TaxID=1706840 RepID=UPI0034463F3C